MTRSPNVNSFKAIMEEIGKKPSPPEWVQYGIPEGTPWKEAIVMRLYRAIIEEGAFHLMPKVMEYSEPSTKRIDIEVRDWRSQMLQMGISPDVVVSRIQEMLGDAIDGEFTEIESGPDSSTGATTQEPRSLALPAVGQSPDGTRDEEFSRRQEEWAADVEPDRETETPGGDGGI